MKFHDGTEMTSKDVKASYDKIIFPPPGVGSSAARASTRDVESVEAPDATTVVFKLKQPSGSFLASLLSPYNFIYKADILAKDPHWYETHIMGTGPFIFVEHVKGSHWVGKKNPNYWDKGKPYLDGFRAIFIKRLRGAGRRDPRRARADPVPRLHAEGPRQPQGGPRRQDHGAGTPVGLRPDGRHRTTRRSRSTTRACAAR